MIKEQRSRRDSRSRSWGVVHGDDGIKPVWRAAHFRDMFLEFDQKRQASGVGFHPQMVGHRLEQPVSHQTAIMDQDRTIVIGIQSGEDVLKQGGIFPSLKAP